MKQINVKKLLLPNLPYVFIALFATKLGQAARLAPGADFSQKALHIMEGFAAAFQSALPSFHPIDLCVGIAAALLIRLAVYVKGKNARKFRKNIEYGSARWGNAEDIKPYTPKSGADLAGGKRYPFPACRHKIMGYLSHVGAACCEVSRPCFFVVRHPCRARQLPVC